MSGFAELADQAAQAAQDVMDKEKNEATPPSQDTAEASQQLGSPENRSQAEQKTAEELADLAKLGRFKFEGQEMSYDDLKRAYLRQQDYTRKTQALADERKFIDNLRYDLDQVKRDPRLIAQFKQIYPEKFHSYLAFVQNSMQSVEPPTTGHQSSVELPPEILERIAKQEEMLNQVVSESRESQTEALNSMFSTIEDGVKKQFPRADMVHVYGAISDYLESEGLTAKELLKNRAATERMFGQFAKASHDAVMKQFKDWQQSELEKIKATNKKAGDIGPGGGTPSQGPKKYRRLSDVQDDILADLNN